MDTWHSKHRQKKGLWQEFKEFLNKGDFLTIAVGLIFALYVKAIVDSLLIGVIYPIIAAIFGKPDFQPDRLRHRRRPHQHRAGHRRHHRASSWWRLILFLLVKGWNRLRREPGEAEGDTELSVLREIREELKTRGPS